MKSLVPFSLVAGLGMTLTVNAQILFDDFNDGVIDPTKWQQISPFGLSLITESGGAMTITGRGIVLAAPAMPSSYSITGSFRRNDPQEFFKIVLRSNLSLSANLESYSERKGIQIAFSDIPSIAIENHISGGGTGPLAYPINAGQFYNFEILDDGANVSVSINGSLVISLATSDSVGNRVAFYGKDFGITSTSFDNITITEVPEPSAIALLGLSFAVFALRRSTQIR